MNLERYCTRSKEDDSRKIVILQHDKVRPPTANKTLQTIRDWKSELLEHQPYDPDLAPGDLHTFEPLKDAVIRDHFSKEEEVKNCCMHGWVRNPKYFFPSGITKMNERGDYVENYIGLLCTFIWLSSYESWHIAFTSWLNIHVRLQSFRTIFIKKSKSQERTLLLLSLQNAPLLTLYVYRHGHKASECLRRIQLPEYSLTL